MRAVPVPAGDSTVELRYRPAHLVAGAVVSLLALALTLASYNTSVSTTRASCARFPTVSTRSQYGS